MILTSQFKIDLIQLKNASHPEQLLEAYKEQAARELGKELVKHFPFVKDPEKSYKGDKLPEASLNREHEYVDLYESSFVVMPREYFRQIVHAINTRNIRTVKELIERLDR